MELSSSNFKIENTTITNVHILFGVLISWTGSINRLSVENMITRAVLLIRDSSSITIQNSHFNTISQGLSSILAYSSYFDEIRNIKYSNIGSANCIYMKNWIVSLIQNFTFENTKIGIELITSSVGIMTSINMTREYSSSITNSGNALNLYSSNVTLQSSTFINNYNDKGGAVYIEWSYINPCDVFILNNHFENNTASDRGGAIYYNLHRPTMSNNTFINKHAPYGNDVASYPVSIVEEFTNSTNIILEGVPSGLIYEGTINLKLVDYDGQVISTENENTAKISIVTPSASFEGTDFGKFVDGYTSLNNLIFSNKPGSVNTQYKVTSNALDTQQIMVGLGINEDKYNLNYTTIISTSFRYCQPGEIISSDGNTCVPCSYDTYSLQWNSTIWENWIQDVECLGEARLRVESGYWRHTTNSTKIIQWPNEKGCLGGYEPENKYPVKCETGYKGHLCTQCDIVGSDKYQSMSNFECSKCPEPVVNAIRVIGLMLAILLYMGWIMIINIRKREENQTSILLRILTNYIQLISVSFYLGVKFPVGFTNMFTILDSVSYPNEAFLSFDWFVEDYQIKMFTPSNMLFKIFCLTLLPLILILIFCCLILLVKLFVLVICKRYNFDAKRSMVIWIISIVSFLHPILALESLRLFQCIQIDDNDHRMLLHMEYKWYSAEHMLWASTVGFSILLIWVFGIPLFALSVLIKYRKKLDDGNVKKYLLMLFQGLRLKAFYWEFVNIFRKVILLCCIVSLYSLPIIYQVLTSWSKFKCKNVFYFHIF